MTDTADITSKAAPESATDLQPAHPKAFTNYCVPVFYVMKDAKEFIQHAEGLVQNTTHGVFCGDNLITLARNLSFLKDEKFTQAFFAHSNSMIEKSIIWRVCVLCWAGAQSLSVDGDLVECGCYTGTTSRILSDYLDLAKTGKSLFLYDLFEHSDDMDHHVMPQHGEGLYEAVCAKFAGEDNVHVVKGAVPGTLHGSAPGRIAYLHIDMNSVAAEIGALDMLFDRVSPGGVIVLDDYGWAGYQDQMLAHQKFFGDRGYPILELPTGQGLVIK